MIDWIKHRLSRLTLIEVLVIVAILVLLVSILTGHGEPPAIRVRIEN